MIIEKKAAVNDVVSVRLVTGEELVGRIAESDTQTLTLSKPIVVQMQMLPNGQATLAFGPFLASCEEAATKFKFDRARLLCEPVKTRDDIKAQYIKMTTGIEVPITGSGLIK
jgi:hypothetical protein